jgi:uncharacterized protein YkwD
MQRASLLCMRRHRPVTFALLSLLVGLGACSELLDYGAVQFEPAVKSPAGTVVPTRCGGLLLGAQDCATCVDTLCCGSARECGDARDCAKLVDCQSGCSTGDNGCKDACETAYPSGLPDFLPLQICLRSSCDSVCYGTPGVGGSGGGVVPGDSGGWAGEGPDGGSCGQDCAMRTYSACSCSAADPCDWGDDGYCDDNCAGQFPEDHFDDSNDCGSGGSGGSGGTGGTSGAGGVDIAGHTCSRTSPGATGNEPDGLIPICCAPTSEERALIDSAFNLLNEHRVASGVNPLDYDPLLEAAIQGHCVHMATHPFSEHVAPEALVSSPEVRADLCGSSAIVENLADGYLDAASVMQSWINSPQHNRHMLNVSFTRVGIGNVNDSWGQLFGE